MLASYSLFASYTYHGELYDFDDIVVGNCSIAMESKLAKKNEVIIKELRYFGELYKNIKLRLFTTNGVGGNLYIMKNRNYEKAYILNTDKSYRVIELSFYHVDQTLDCKVRDEE